MTARRGIEVACELGSFVVLATCVVAGALYDLHGLIGGAAFGLGSMFGYAVGVPTGQRRRQ